MRIGLRVRVGFRHLVMMAEGSVGGYGMHYVHKCPHKGRSTNRHVCSWAPTREHRAMFRLVAERDTEGLFPPSPLSLPFHINKLQ